MEGEECFNYWVNDWKTPKQDSVKQKFRLGDLKTSNHVLMRKEKVGLVKGKDCFYSIVSTEQISDLIDQNTVR